MGMAVVAQVTDHVLRDERDPAEGGFVSCSCGEWARWYGPTDPFSIDMLILYEHHLHVRSAGGYPKWEAPL